MLVTAPAYDARITETAGPLPLAALAVPVRTDAERAPAADMLAPSLLRLAVLTPAPGLAWPGTDRGTRQRAHCGAGDGGRGFGLQIRVAAQRGTLARPIGSSTFARNQAVADMTATWRRRFSGSTLSSVSAAVWW